MTLIEFKHTLNELERRWTKLLNLKIHTLTFPYPRYVSNTANQLRDYLNRIGIDYDHSSSMEMALKLNIPELAYNYSHPEGLSSLDLGCSTLICYMYAALENTHNRFNKRWLLENNDLPYKLSLLNDYLIELNPDLILDNRPTPPNFQYEYNLFCGILYKRNPYDINHFLNSRVISEIDNIPQEIAYSEGILSTKVLTILLQEKFPDLFIDTPLKLNWIVSSDTVNLILTKMNVYFPDWRSVSASNISDDELHQLVSVKLSTTSHVGVDAITSPFV